MRIEYSFKDILLFIIHWIVIFGLIFEMPIVSFLTTRRLSLIIAIISLFIRPDSFKKTMHLFNGKIIVFFALMAICFFISLINYSPTDSSNNSYFEPWYIAYIIFYVFFFSVYVVARIESSTKFTWIILSIFVFQSLVVIYSFMNTEFRLFIYNNFYVGDDRFDKTVTEGLRIVGIGTLHSATGSIMMASAFGIAIYMRIKGIIRDVPFMMICTLLFITTLFIGRTGVVVEAAMLLLYSLNGKNLLKALVLGAVVYLAGDYFLYTLLSSSDTGVGDNVKEWMGAIFDIEVRNRYAKNVVRTVPDLTLEMIFGTGVMEGSLPGGRIFNSDSGYIQIYCSIGIIGAFLYYSAFLFLFRSVKYVRIDKKIKLYIYALIIIAFAIEYKEPFLLKYTYPWSIMVIMLFEAQNNRNRMLNKINN